MALMTGTPENMDAKSAPDRFPHSPEPDLAVDAQAGAHERKRQAGWVPEAMFEISNIRGTASRFPDRSSWASTARSDTDCHWLNTKCNGQLS